MDKCRNEYEYLIHLVKCSIHGEQPLALPVGFDFRRVYECGVYHHVANIAFYSVEQLTQKPEPGLYRQWEACRDRAVILDINQGFAAEEITGRFRQEGIRWLEVQGTKIKPLYPAAEYRTMSDIDLIIDPQNLSRAQSILQELGYHCEEIRGEEVDGFRPPNINVEIHTQYFSRLSEYCTVMKPPFSSVEETGSYDINEFYIYNILHIAKHYFYGGCGIRRVLDAYYLNRNYGKVIRRDYVKTVLDKANVTDFAEKLGALAEYWFGEGKQPACADEMADYILRSGLHGTGIHELDNRVRPVADSGTASDKAKYLLRRFTGTKRILLDTYPILEQWPVLYPFCWLHRGFRSLRPSKVRKLKKEIKTVTQKH